MLVAFAGLEQRPVLWHTVALVLPPAFLCGCEAWRCLGMGTPVGKGFVENPHGLTDCLHSMHLYANFEEKCLL